MNKSLRQLFTIVVALFVILGMSTTIITAIRANQLNNDPRNTRALYHEYGAPRGAILASDGSVIAKSDPSNDAFSYQRSYTAGELYAPVTGFFSISQRGWSGIEASRSSLLSGQSDQLVWQRFKSLFTGQENKGATIETSIDPKIQQAAYNGLANNDGAAVAIEVKTGRILAMASTPSYDPNQLASHDTSEANGNYSTLSQDESNPMLNRATSQLYPPGSTFKTVVAAAALETGEYQTDTEIPAGSSYTLPGTVTQLTNAVSQADGSDGKITLEDAMAYSSNTAFAQLGVALGDDKVSSMAKKLGFDSPITVDGSDSTGTPWMRRGVEVPDRHDRRQARFGVHRPRRHRGDSAAERAGGGRRGERGQGHAADAGGSRAFLRPVCYFADQAAGDEPRVQFGHRQQAHADDGGGGHQGEPESGHRRRAGDCENRHRADR